MGIIYSCDKLILSCLCRNTGLVGTPYTITIDLGRAYPISQQHRIKCFNGGTDFVTVIHTNIAGNTLFNCTVTSGTPQTLSLGIKFDSTVISSNTVSFVFVQPR